MTLIVPVSLCVLGSVFWVIVLFLKLEGSADSGRLLTSSSKEKRIKHYLANGSKLNPKYVF